MKPKDGSVRREAGTNSVDIIPSVKDGIFLFRGPNMYAPTETHLGMLATIYGISDEDADRLENGDATALYGYLKEFRDFPGVYRILASAELQEDVTGSSITMDHCTIEEYSLQPGEPRS